MGCDSILYWGQNIGTLKRWNIRFVKWKVIPYCTEDKTLEHCNISVVKLVVIPYCDLALREIGMFCCNDLVLQCSLPGEPSQGFPLYRLNISYLNTLTLQHFAVWTFGAFHKCEHWSVFFIGHWNIWKFWHLNNLNKWSVDMFCNVWQQTLMEKAFPGICWGSKMCRAMMPLAHLMMVVKMAQLAQMILTLGTGYIQMMIVIKVSQVARTPYAPFF